MHMLLVLLLLVAVVLQLSTPASAFQVPAPWRVRHAPLRSVTMATPNSASQHQQHDDGNEALLTIVIERAASHTVMPGALATHGRLLKNSNSQPVTLCPPNEEISFNLVAGRNAATQEPVLAFVGPAAANFKPGTELRVPAGAVLSRPASLSLEECALLPYHAVSLLPPLMRAGIHGGEGSSGPASSKVCIVTGCGPAAIFAIQVLRAWGCRVVGVSRRNLEVLTKAGAEEVVDCRTTSFSEQVPSFAAVVDTVGTDTEALAANLRKFKDAAYVSTMPSATRRMQAQGLFQAASTFASVFWGKPDVAPTNLHWLPEKQGLDVISYVLKLAEAKHLTMPLTPPTLDDYMDGVVWAKDSETQARFGFPAPVPEGGLTEALISRVKERISRDE